MKKLHALSASMLAFTAMFMLTVFVAATAPAQAGETMHKVAIHVDEADPKRMNMALNNVKNVRKYYDSVGEEVMIELVAYGPGLHMLRADTSPVATRIATMALEIDNLVFSACGNTHSKMSKKSGKDIKLLSEARMVKSGVVQLIALQEQGYSYVRP